MKTEKEIRERKEEDLQFVISAVTSELHDMAYLTYFTAWEMNGGMQWFFDECVQITHKVMLTEGSKYLEWLDYWAKSDEEHVMFFSEYHSDSLDWFHMTEARVEFKSRYNKDECTKDQISECIAHLLNQFDTDTDRADLMAMSKAYALKERENDKLRKIIQDLKEINADAKTMEKISKRLGIK